MRSAGSSLAPGQPWWLIAAMGVSAAFLIMSFYSEVAAWVFAYIFKAASGGSSPPIPPSRVLPSIHSSRILAESALAVAGAGPDGGSC
jgi:SNF family Na+-dependent transporter